MSGFDGPIGVIGFGTMGTGIAQSAAQAGFEVLVWEQDVAQREAGLRRMQQFLAGGVTRGKLSETEAQAVVERVNLVDQANSLGDCNLVIETIFEDLEAKSALLSEVSVRLRPEALLASNTSALSLTELATAVADPTRFGGLHFFNPAPVMSVVEVIGALQTAPGTLDRLRAFVEAINKTPVVAKDRPGFLVNHLLIPYLNDVIGEYDSGLAEAEDLDTAVKLGLGYRTGPLELLDLIGLDVHLHASQAAYDETGDPGYAPPSLLRRMVAAGYTGQKSGRGFRVAGEKRRG